jgi:hypothetical protein
MLRDAGIDVAFVYGQKGKGWIDKNLAGYNLAAGLAPWLVVRDLNSDADCAPTLRMRLLPTPAADMRFRIAVKSVESGLLADRERMSEFLRVPITRLPHDPDSLNNPKRFIVDLARRSKLREIREDIVPAFGMSGTQGPAYTSRIIEFARGAWRPRIAARTSDSLRRCIASIRTLVW